MIKASCASGQAASNLEDDKLTQLSVEDSTRTPRDLRFMGFMGLGLGLRFWGSGSGFRVKR